MNRLRFVLAGPPPLKRRHRHDHGGRTPKKTVQEELWVRQSGIAAVLRWRAATGEHWNPCGRFRLTIEYHAQDAVHRDLSNMIKAIEDGLNGIAWDDDWQIDSLRIERYFRKRDDDDRPIAAVVIIERLEGPRL